MLLTMIMTLNSSRQCAAVLMPFLWLGLAAVQGRAQDLEQLIEARPGRLPIILTVPHGGTVKPNTFRTRTLGKMMQDANTAELSERISQELQRQYGAAPHIVFCRLHRSKIDCNREIDEATEGDPMAVAAWNRFHGAAAEMCKQVTRQHGAGLLLDIHGHRHEVVRVELGYLISGSQLAVSDSSLDANLQLMQQSSIRELDARSPASFSELLRGPTSLGGLLERLGIPAVPSPKSPDPGGASYFSGAYDIAEHGSRKGGTVSGIQVECPWEGVRDTVENQQRFAKALAEALGVYFRAHFGFALSEKKDG